MARTIKQGLDYFPFDVDFYQDLKIRKLIKYQGGKAISVYTLLLCIIYRNGYYIRWDKELPFMISELTGYTEANIQEVIECCMNIGLLSRELFESEGILTSKGIQARYAGICSSSRRRGTIAEYSLMPRKSADGVTGSKGKKTRHQPQQTDSKDSAVSAPPASKEKAPRKKKTAERPADPPAEYSLTVDPGNPPHGRRADMGRGYMQEPLHLRRRVPAIHGEVRAPLQERRRFTFKFIRCQTAFQRLAEICHKESQQCTRRK